MTYRENMQLWVREALGELGGEGTIVEVAKELWDKHSADFKADDRFYTWQYDMRWAANQLRRKAMLGLRAEGTRSIWLLKK